MDCFQHDTAVQLYDLLQQQRRTIVFAESCTAGLIAASLSQLPGISQWLAGSAVVYQVDSKAAWLRIDPQVLTDRGPVSQTVSEQMARGVLDATPHADIAASVTGHLGPDAPPDLDGTAWCSLAIKENDTVTSTSRRLRLDARRTDNSPENSPPASLRRQRQLAAVQQVLEYCIQCLRPHSADSCG